MQIGDPSLDAIFNDVIVPALAESEIEAKRVDKHNDGRLLNSEIARLIAEAEIIVADLTNERQNCYLEVGYAMGLGKFENLLLCARVDHKPDRPGRNEGDPKVHFDLGGYDLLYWSPDDLEGFRKELAARVRRRLRLPRPARVATEQPSLAVATVNFDNTVVWWDRGYWACAVTVRVANLSRSDDIVTAIELTAETITNAVRLRPMAKLVVMVDQKQRYYIDNNDCMDAPPGFTVSELPESVGRLTVLRLRWFGWGHLAETFGNDLAQRILDRRTEPMPEVEFRIRTRVRDAHDKWFEEVRREPENE